MKFVDFIESLRQAKWLCEYCGRVKYGYFQQYCDCEMSKKCKCKDCEFRNKCKKAG